MNSTTERDLYWAVHSAIHSGVSASEFQKAAAELWQQVLDEKKKSDAQSWGT